MNQQEREKIRLYLEKLVDRPVRSKPIRAIVVSPLYHGQPKRRIEVGQCYSDLEPGEPSRQVVAIFESDSFLVCTPERGAGEGLPYFFTRNEVRKVEEGE